MRKKEMKNLAKRIAKAENIVNTSTDDREVREAQEVIMALSNQIEPEDMMVIDDMVQEILSTDF